MVKAGHDEVPVHTSRWLISVTTKNPPIRALILSIHPTKKDMGLAPARPAVAAMWLAILC